MDELKQLKKDWQKDQKFPKINKKTSYFKLVYIGKNR